MSLSAVFLMHVLPKGFRRIRHYGLFASGSHAANVARARKLLCAAAPARTSRSSRGGKYSQGGGAGSLLSILRWTDDRHRALRKRLQTAISAKPRGDRQLMSLVARRWNDMSENASNWRAVDDGHSCAEAMKTVLADQTCHMVTRKQQPVLATKLASAKRSRTLCQPNAKTTTIRRNANSP
jgi:hypothetical protein